jgi:hypothetical protein
MQDNDAHFCNATQHMLDANGFFAGHPADSAEARLQQLQAMRPEDMEPEAIAEYLEALRSHKAEVCPARSPLELSCYTPHFC